ncbi:MAG TPA: transcriptional repressor NrdR [Dehalococcoidia bacterium]|nr:transcriptional repressor NrdR [Dehalococcoidia bacterium]
MNCPYCGHIDSKVIDSRDVNDGIRRRRQCLECGSRFTTYERLQPASLFVIKKDSRREEYDRDKLLNGVRKACEKRPLEAGAVESLVDDIETGLFQMGRTEVPTATIGDMVMARLKKLDHIAYIRFASVYREFEDITTLKEEVDTLADNMTFHSADQLPLIPPDEMTTIVKSPRRSRR